ncbi:MAG: glycerophosphodiester phosphodiesterase family protein [Candidatus Thalassarchaeaceae archaeon]|nr:glycerophosphodiester phosphodiesterase family protein [Candidatus Thalassarchaeaceae archaeon]MDP7043725.1 glycerophosphodiester phosphodiesterase family protein [Candidatus Thalassarchaeaceae archaeon]
MSWSQPRENSIDAIKMGINHFDGVEFDLRLSADGVLMLHHDNKIAGGKYFENQTADEVKSIADTFDELMNTSEFTRPWQEEGKTVCIELKSPHPNSGVAGGWKGGSKKVDYLVKMIQMVDEALSDLDLPEGTTVIYAFDKKFLSAVNKAGCQHPHAILMPRLREWSSGNFNKALATPSFIAHSMPRLMKKHQKWGAPMVPCALDYLSGFTRHLTLGTTVGLSGRGLERLTKKRKGFPAFIWPVPITEERAVLDAGLTAITDTSSPETTQLPDGSERRTKPATEPLLDNDSPWNEMSEGEHRELLTGMKKRWLWSRSVDELVNSSSANQIPWEVPRIIGHRGTGRTYHSIE